MDTQQLRSKRQKKSSTDDPNNSFVKKVTNRVSGLFSNPLGSWFKNDTSAGSRTRSRDSESDSDDSSTVQPPTKRARNNQINSNLSQEIPEQSILLTNITRDFHNAPSTSGTHNRLISSTPAIPLRPTAQVQSVKTLNIKKHTRTVEIQRVNSTDHSDSGDSTSGCESMVNDKAIAPKIYDVREKTLINEDRRKEPFSEVHDGGNTSTRESKPSSRTPSIDRFSTTAHLQSPRSLFSEQSSTPGLSTSHQQPSFNSSAFVSYNASSKHTPGVPQNTLRSPFYPGRTTYGGASAYSKAREMFSMQDKPQTRSSIQIKPLNKSDTSSQSQAMSQTARRILEALEQFSSPITDARKIPVTPALVQSRRRFGAEERAQNQTLGHSQRLSNAKPYSRVSDMTRRYYSQELQVPTVPDLLKMKKRERLQDSTNTVREMAATSNSILNRSEAYTIRTAEDARTESTKQTNKIKTSKKDRNITEDPPPAVNLPSIELPITSLPKFDIKLPQIPKPTKPETTKPSETVKPVTTYSNNITAEKSILNQTHPVVQNPIYTFSTPIKVSDGGSNISPINNFKFSSPLSTNNIDKDRQLSMKFDSSNVVLKLKRNVQEPSNGGVSTSTVLKTGSVMDILGTPKNQDVTKLVSNLDAFKSSASSTWECSSCLIRNKNDVEKCIACESLKPAQKASGNAVPLSVSLRDKFKMAADEWECTACMVRNKADVSKCVACTTPKIGNNPVANVKLTANTLVGMFKPPANTWSCGVCMITNQNSSEKCIACEGPKPGVTLNASSTFTDLVKKQNAKWECTGCMTRNDHNKSKCVCCEAPKPGVIPESSQYNFGSASSTQFKFGIDQANDVATVAATPILPFGNATQKKDDTIATPVFGTASTPGTNFTFGSNVTAEPIKGGFTFGCNTTTAPSSTAGFTFGNNATAAGNNKTETKNTTASTTGFVFGSSKKESETPKSSETHAKSETTPLQKSNSSKTTDVVDTTKIEPVVKTVEETPKPEFAFGILPTTTESAMKPNAEVKPGFSFPGANLVPAFAATPVISTTTPGATSTGNSLFSFGSNLKTTPSNIMNSTPPTMTFGSLKRTAPGSDFTFGSTPATPTAPGKSDSEPSNKKSTFGGSAMNNTASIIPAFPSVNASQSKTEPKPFAFGASSGLNENKAFSFTAGSADKGSPKPAVFAFGAQSTPLTNNGAFTFSASQKPNFNFGGAKIEAASVPTTNFGAPASGALNFGSTSAGGFGTAAINPMPATFGTPAPATAFNFGAQSANPGSGLAFGGSMAPAASSGGFSFGSSTLGGAPVAPAPGFDAAKPAFNFSVGAPPSAFSAGSASSASAARKIKRAVRRTTPR